MKRLVRDGLIVILYYTGIVWVYRRWQRRHGPLVRIVCFHDVPDRVWFEAVVAMLTERYHVITPEQFHQREFQSGQINILLTFDDGYQSWVEVALPVMERHGVKGIFFITSGLLDAAEEGAEAVAHFVHDRLRLTRTYHTLTWDGAKALVEAGHTIGGHTATHSSLGELVTEADITHEVEADKQRLESKLSVTLTDFAYPFGKAVNMSSAADTIIANAGFAHSYSAETGFATPQQPYRRTMVETAQSPTSLKRWIAGAYDLVSR